MEHDVVNPERGTPAQTIRLVVSDIDGTLVTRDKQLTEAALKAARDLRAAGIALCLVSSRAPRGMEMFLAPLEIDTPRAGLNGGLITSPDGTILSRLSLEPQAVAAALDMLDVHGVDAWLFRGHDWLVRNAGGAYVGKEEAVVQTRPTIVRSFDDYHAEVGKIMGSSTDYPLLERMEIEIGAMLEGQASVHRSSDYYLDITHPDANKGYAACALAARLGLDISEVACIGDMSNDIPMLKVAGLAIAMGNAPETVKSHAHFVTASNEHNGWARAMEQIVLPRAPRA
ncbi:Cof-type HAD-IIB family hydrolase [Ameyamaea chiangmaiensis]|nr:Cof-type HAD-IIB family hydrolase [Ameyamaea chiangmaiensis]